MNAPTPHITERRLPPGPEHTYAENRNTPSVPMQPATVGIVVIGRNEGPRLADCLAGVLRYGCPLVYVDSGSTDDSLAVARQADTEIHALDLATPLSAARARNEGLTWLLEREPGLAFVQFVDGDCLLDPDWIQTGQRFLQANPDVAAVCGRLRERNRTASVYHRLCDMEWNGPTGEIPFCGGIAMMRVAAFQQVGGFDPTLIAGEEPDLCTRLRQQGWRICRLAEPMAVHQATIIRFTQWWRRTKRAGYCYAQLTHRYRDALLCPFRRHTRSAWFWGCMLPIAAVTAAWPTTGTSLALLLAGYLVLAVRIYRKTRRRALARTDAALYAGACMVAKFPQVLGQLRFHLHRLAGTRGTLIEYKTVPPAPPPASAADARSV